MNATAVQSKGFRRWIAMANQQRAATLEHAVSMLVVPLLGEGFHWLDKSFDCGVVPIHTINLERERVPGQVDYVQVVFDKRHRPQFQVLMGTKRKEPPHEWVRAGALVWKIKSESVTYKLWGTRWWEFGSEAAFVRRIDAAAAKMPQVLRFLTDGIAGESVWETDLRASALMN